MKKDYRPVSETDSVLSETAFVEEYWTRVWDCMDRSSALAEQIERREEFGIIKPYLANLLPGSRILDGGCGLGDWTLYYASKGLDVTGLDISRATVQKLKEKFPHGNFMAGDIRSTGFKDNSFDVYFSWGAFEHFEEGLGAPLKEARRILKQGGLLFISVPFQNGRHLRRDRRELWHWDETYDRDSGYQTERRFYQWRLTKPELHREFEMNGFKKLEITAIGKDRGVLGVVRHDLHIKPDSRLGTLAQMFLRPFLFRDFVAHMLVGVARKV